MIRTILIVVFVFFFLIAGIPVNWVVTLIGKKNPEKKDNISLRFVQGGFRIVTFLSGVKLSVSGLENIPTDRGSVLIGNHRSYFDIVLLFPLMPRPTGFLAKDNLLKVPLLTTWMRNIHCLFLNRAETREGMKTILDAINEVKSGISLVIFPEGTREKTEGEVAAFHAGSFKVATKAGAPVVPVCLTHTGQVLEDHWPKTRPVNVKIIFGEPVETAGMSREEHVKLPERIRGWISETYKENA